MDPAPLLRVSGLRTWFHTDDGLVKAVDDVSFEIAPGRTLGVVGESGSGKSVTSLTVMRLLPDRSAQIASGSVSFLGRDLTTLSNRAMAEVRGRQIAMIFQEPMTSLNPVVRVGAQVVEAVRRHRRCSRREAQDRAVALFREVGIPDPERRVASWPHEMSGGQKQRVMIAMALACDPQLLIADEPTTALDVTIQAQILDLLRRLRDERGMAMLFITHDLGVIAEIADDVCVMYRGRVVERGPVEQIFAAPQHPYTKGLLACRPRLDTPYAVLPTVDDFMSVRERDGEVVIEERELDAARLTALQTPLPGRERHDASAPLLEVRDLHVRFPIRTDAFGRPRAWHEAVAGVSFEVARGRTLGLVGESGCGKTTLGRAILRLVEPAAGTIRLRPAEGPPLDLHAVDRAQLVAVRRKLQIVFQDPYSSLNPRMSVGAALIEPMRVHGIGHDDADRRERAAALLREVGLAPDHLRRYPHEFSGGQRQRLCIARALAVEPEFLVCDESVSALDVSVQAQVLNLLRELQARRGLTYLFISHDLSVVKFMSDTMCVMQAGRVVEAGPPAAIYEDPQQEYTKRLIAAIPDDSLGRIRARVAGTLPPAVREAPLPQPPQTVTAPVDVLDVWFSSHGRLGRAPYVRHAAGVAAVGIAGAAVAQRLLGPDVGGVVAGAVALPAAWAGSALQTKRLHDLGQRGWALAVWLAALAAAALGAPWAGAVAIGALTVALAAAPGAPGPNRYGPPGA